MELDEAVVGVARRWFGLGDVGGRLKVIVQDAIDFVKEAQEEGWLGVGG